MQSQKIKNRCLYDRFIYIKYELIWRFCKIEYDVDQSWNRQET